MKYSKKSVKNIFILIVIAFLIIPIVFIVFKLNPHEGYTNYTFLDTQNKDINRVDISGVSISYGDGTTADQTYTGLSGESIYCPGGNITCADGFSVQEIGDYTTPGGKTAKSYKYLCKDNSTGQESAIEHVTCNNYLSNSNKDALYIQEEYVDGNSENIKYFDITASGDNSKHLLQSGLAGFTNPFVHVPLEISGNYLHIYDQSGVTKFKASPCFLFEDSSNCIANYYGSDSTDVSTNTTDSSCPSSIKCVADNGSGVGDPLCCGQTGVVQDTKFNCPSEYPHCVGYKCGESWGKCSTTPSQ